MSTIGDCSRRQDLSCLTAKMQEHEDNFISGIHNYCDRWCDRCEFTARCSVFAMEQEFTDEEKDPSNEAFVRKLSDIFAQAKQMLVEKAEEMGIDPIAAVNDPEIDAIRAREDAYVDGNELAQLAEKYGWDVRPVLEASADWLIVSDLDEETQAEVLAVLHWYQFFIAAKARRAIHGLLDFDGFEDLSQLDDPQSDANGTAKLTLIAVERSILAWTYLLSPDNAETVRPLIHTLEKIKRLTEERFPRAYDFIRPGFDEIETVM